MDYLELLENSREELVNAVCESVRIKSVNDKPVAGPNGEIYPFGKGIEDAYQNILALGASMGFDVQDFDHYGGHIEWKSEDSRAEIFGIAAHVDVVPEGDGWTHDPYGGEVEDGWIYGRGTTDDKGPLLECLYAMKALRDSGMKPKHTVRLIVGTDEESGKGGMVNYLERAGMPDFGFTPDGDFPLVNGEMGMVIFDFVKRMKPVPKNEGLHLRKLEAGTAPNVVPRVCKAVLYSQDSSIYAKIQDTARLYHEETGYEVTTKKTGTSLAIEAHGIAAHGATPEHGLNAISIMMDFLGRFEFASEDTNDIIEYYNKHIGFNLAGEEIGCAFEDEQSGKLIFNVGMAEFSQDVATLTINIRYPVTFTDEQVFEGIDKTLVNTNIGILKKIQVGPVYLSTDEEFVQKMLQAYSDETGDTECTPLVIGGGTYAKMFKRVLAFGALFPGDEDRMHQADERINIEQMMKAARVYARAIKSICE